jgi:molecular chaperone GrpE
MTDDSTPGPESEPQDDQYDAAEAFLAGADETEALRAEVAQLKEQILRYAAEAENTKRRAERETNDARAFAIQKFATSLLGVADNLARALQHAPRDSDDTLVKNLVVGLEMTEKELMLAFERNGLKRLDPERGAKFDPHQHQAMMEQPADDVAAGSVLQVMQSGYELFGRNVRPAMVVVSAKGSGKGASNEPVSESAANPYVHSNPEADAGASIDRKA